MGNNYDITELLRTKGFSDLNAKEKAYVLNQLEDEQEYESLRNIVLESKDDMTTDLRAKEAVMAAFDEEFSDSNPGESKNRRKFWPYMAAAATVIVLLVIGSLFMNDKEDQLAENKVVQKKDSLISDTLEEPENETDLKDEEVEEENTSDPETVQIAELKQRDSREIKYEKEPAESIIEFEADIEESIVQEDKLFLDEAPEEEITELQDKAEAASSEPAKSKKPMVDEVRPLSEASSRAITAAETQWLGNNVSSEESENKKQWVDFKLKRINKNHYTSY